MHSPRRSGVVALLRNRRAASMLAVAACLVIMLGAGLLWNTASGREVPFGELDAALLPELTLTVRGGEGEYAAADFEAQVGLDLSALLPGYALEEATATQGANAQGDLLSVVDASYSNGEQSLRLQLSDFETVLYAAMDDLEPAKLGGAAVRFAQDSQDGTLYAAWSDGGLFWVVQQRSGDTDAFVQLIRQTVKAR